jgi:hypothetical protein
VFVVEVVDVGGVVFSRVIERRYRAVWVGLLYGEYNE